MILKQTNVSKPSHNCRYRVTIKSSVSHCASAISLYISHCPYGLRRPDFFYTGLSEPNQCICLSGAPAHFSGLFPCNICFCLFSAFDCRQLFRSGLCVPSSHTHTHTHRSRCVLLKQFRVFKLLFFKAVWKKPVCNKPWGRAQRQSSPGPVPGYQLVRFSRCSRCSCSHN